MGRDALSWWRTGVRGGSGNGSPEDELGCWPGDPSAAGFAGAELSSGSGGCGVPASLSSLPPARSLSEPWCSPLQRPPAGLRCLRAPSSPPLGVSLSGCPSIHPPLCLRASLIDPGSAPGPALQPSSPAPKPEVQAGDLATAGACAKPAAATPRRSLGWRDGAPGRGGVLPERGAPTLSPLPVRCSRGNCLGGWIQEEPSVPGACARVVKGALDSVVARKGAGGRSDVYRDSRSTVGMIHELLLALSGYPGSIFTWNKRSGLQVLTGPQRGNRRALNG